MIFLALLFASVRGDWIAARGAFDRQLSAPPSQLNQTLGDKLSDQVPTFPLAESQIRFFMYWPRLM